MGTLDQEEIAAIHAATVREGLSLQRDALLARVAPAYVASLTRSDKPDAQTLLDLHAMNESGPLGDGSSPLAIWLQNGLRLASSESTKATFRAALDRLGAARERESAPLDAPPPTPPRLERWSSVIATVLAVSALVFGRLPAGSAGDVLDVEITDQTDRDLPGLPLFSRRPAPLDRLAEVFDGVVAGGPRAVAIAVDLGPEGRSNREIDVLAGSIRRARARAVRVIVPLGAADRLVEAAGGEVAASAVVQGPFVLGQPVRGVPLDGAMPLSLQLLGVTPPLFAEEAVLPLGGHCADAVRGLPALAAIHGPPERFLNAYVVLGGALTLDRSDADQGRVVVGSAPWSAERVSASQAHAMIAACASGGALRWELPVWPWILASLGALIAEARRAKRVAMALEIGLGALAVATTLGSRYLVPVWPLMIAIAASTWRRRCS
ncbi:MAG: hypothetical protein U0359_15065 [Byssovorax sp.]